MLTTPGPVKARFVTSAMTAGPDATSNATGSPLDAVAASVTVLVTQWLPMAGKSIVWPALVTVIEIVTGGAKSQIGSPSCQAITLTTPAAVKASLEPSESVPGPEYKE